MKYAALLDYHVTHPDLDPHGWIRIRWKSDGRYPVRGFPFLCVVCLTPTEHRWRYASRNTELSIGVCPECEAYWLRRRSRLGWIVGLPLLGVSIALFAILYHITGSAGNSFGPSACLFGLGMLLLYALASRFGGPVQLGGYPFGDTWIRFRNPAFTAIYLGLPSVGSGAVGDGKGDIQN
jgi:hypothetical protein